MAYRRGNSFGSFSSNLIANHYHHFRHGATFVFLYVTLAVLLSSIANAQNQSDPQEDSSSKPIIFKYIDLYIGPSMIADIQHVLGLDDNQIPLIRKKHEAYFAKLQQFADELSTRIDEAGFTKTKELLQAVGGRYLELDQEEYGHHWRAWRNERVDGLATSDLLLDEFLIDLHEVLNVQQIEKISQLQYRIWRKNYQRSSLRKGLSRSDFVAADIDVAKLTWAYLEDEVWTLLENDPDLRIVIMSEIGDHLAAYDLNYYYAVKGRFANHRRKPGADDLALVSDGTKLSKDIIASWKSLYKITKESVQSIARTLGDRLGEKHEHQYLSRFHLLLCPSIFAERIVDRMSKWLVDFHNEIPKESIEAVELLIEQYRIRRDIMRNRALRLGMVAMRKYMIATGDDRDQQNYEEARYRLRLLTLDTVRTVLATLPALHVAEELNAKIEADYRLEPQLKGPLLSINADKRL